MSEFGTYLAKLREHLDVTSARAEEIIAETYSHLEEHARQLMEAGLSREEAVREAEKAMGDPAALAAQITHSNERHRTPSALRALAAIAVVFAVWLTLDPAGNLWADSVAQWLAHHAILSVAGANRLFLFVGLASAALLGGGVGGRRYWWVVSTPTVLAVAITWGATLLQGHLIYARPEMEVAEGLIVPLAATLWMGAIAWGASRSSAPPVVRHAVGSVVAVLLVAASVEGIIHEVTLAQSAFLALVLAEGAALLLSLAAYAERRIGKQQLSGRFLVICGASALALGTVAALIPAGPSTSGTISGALATLAATAALAAVVGTLRTREALRARPRPQ
jgi:HAAS